MLGYIFHKGDYHIEMDASRGMKSNGSFSILTLNGGGARGIYSARLLARIEQSLGWTLRISSGVSKGIYKSVVQSDREFLRIGVGDLTLYKS